MSGEADKERALTRWTDDLVWVAGLLDVGGTALVAVERIR